MNLPVEWSMISASGATPPPGRRS